MAATKKDIREWLEYGKSEGATHVIVVCDTFDWDDFPVLVFPDENAKDKANEYAAKPMSKVMEVYNLSMDWDKQLNSGRAFNAE